MAAGSGSGDEAKVSADRYSTRGVQLLTSPNLIRKTDIRCACDTAARFSNDNVYVPNLVKLNATIESIIF